METKVENSKEIENLRNENDAENSSRTCILVLGMHRSGTSAITRVLSLMGASLPLNIMGPSKGNEAGHWEPEKLVTLHDELLSELDSSWDDWQSIDLTQLTSDRLLYYKNQIKKLIKDDFKDAKLFVLKDPRVCKLLSFYKEIFSEIDVELKIVSQFRNPIDVMDSLKARDGMLESDGALLWLDYVLHAERASRGLERVFIKYDDVINDWKKSHESIRSSLDIDWPYGLDEIEGQVDQFISPKLCHHSHKDEEVLFDPLLRQWVGEAYSALLVLQKNPNSETAQKRIDEIADEFEKASPMLVKIKSTVSQSYEKQLDEGEQLLAQKEDVIAEHKQLIAQTNEIIAEREQQIAQKDEMIAERDQQITQKDEMIAERDQQIAQKDEVITERELQIAQGERIVDEQVKKYNITLEQQKNLFITSNSWKITRPLRLFKAMTKDILIIKQTLPIATRKYGFFKMMIKGMKLYSQEGIAGISRRISSHKNNIQKDVQSINFINSVIPRRRSTLLSNWHCSYNDMKKGNADSSKQSITVSVVTYNSDHWLNNFLTSLEKQSFPTQMINLIFVDHNSTDKTLNTLKEYKDNSKHIFKSMKIISQKNKGFGGGHDTAIKHSSDDFVLITNVDLEFHNSSILNAVNFAISDDAEICSWELRQLPYEHPKYYDPVTLETSWSSHACVLIRRSAYKDVGGYDNKIFMYGEDVELSYRFRANGFRLRYLPIATITHHVDLKNDKLRPHQLSGSISSNLLNRYRYGTEEDIAIGNQLLDDLIFSEQDPKRRQSLINAKLTVEKNKCHFENYSRPENMPIFSFSGFDYDIRRDGCDIQLTPALSCAYLPKVTIITRTYGPNTSSLKETIVSVLNQTYHNIEYIIVEDRTDYAENLIVEINSKYETNIRYFTSDGFGRSRAGNFGLEKSTGDYIMFLDNDDLIFSDHVELLSQYLIENKKHVSAYSLAWEVKTINKGDKEYEEVEHIIHEGHKLPFSKERLKKCNFIPIQSILFKRQLYEKFGGFDESLDYLEDWNLWVRYSQGGDFLFVPKLTSLFRTPAESQSRADRQNNLDLAYDDVLKKNLDAINERGISIV